MLFDKYVGRLLLSIVMMSLFTTAVKAQEEEIDTLYEDEYIEEGLQFEVDSIYQSLFQLDRNFYFDTTLIPAGNLYNSWDTMVIDPYGLDPSKTSEPYTIVLNDGDDCFYYPPCSGMITSGFGYRKFGYRRYKGRTRYRYQFHYGIDLKLHTGDPVRAAFDGVVRIAKYSTSYGYMVLIRHYNGLETLYAHFSKLLVANGQTVRAGDVIGLGGSTGRSTGSHLHFEIRFKGKQIDPSKVISFSENRLLTDTLTIDNSTFKYLVLAKSQSVSQGGYKKYHTVRSGETLSGIARKYGTTVTRIKQLNGLRSDRIQAGRRLRVK